MAAEGQPARTHGMIVSALIIGLGIIHLGVGAGIVGKYRRYNDIFRQPVGLSGFNIVVGIFAIPTGIVCLIAIMQRKAVLSKIGAICSGILGTITVVSLLTALVINSQAISFMRARLLYRMNTYISTDSSVTVMDAIQYRYQCCGVNLWIDYASVNLGTTTTTGRRRRHVEMPVSPLIKAVRKSRQSAQGSTYYNLPSTYTINLPLSCCKNGGSSLGNSIGGSCVFSANNGTTAFYVQGCLPTVANLAVSAITGIAVINVCLAILAIVLIPLLMHMFPATFDRNNPNNKQSLQDQMRQEQQMQNGGYYAQNNNPNVNYGYPQPQQQQPPQPTYVVYQ